MTRAAIALAAVAVAACSKSERPPRASCDLVEPSTESVDASAPILVGAGDIGDCSNGCAESTGALLDRIDGTVFAAGDVAYEDGSLEQFAECYEPGWGRHKSRTRPAVGNHEYHIGGAADYFEYWGAAAGTAGQGWYSFDIANWHVVVLNSNCDEVDCGPGSPQLDWLEADLAASTANCTAAIWHHARWSTGNHGNHGSVAPFVELLYAHGAELLIAGHDHSYERIGPRRPDGTPDAAFGLRSFVVGTGGKSPLYHWSRGRFADTEARDNNHYGVLRLDLGADGYGFEFVPVVDGGFTDAGSGICHGAPGG